MDTRPSFELEMSTMREEVERLARLRDDAWDKYREAEEAHTVLSSRMNRYENAHEHFPELWRS